MIDPKLTKISGVGPATAQMLADHGFATVEAVAAASNKELAKVPGFAEARAASVIAAARALAGGDTSNTGKKEKKRKDRKGDKSKSKKSKKGKARKAGKPKKNKKDKGKKDKKGKKGKKGKKKRGK